MCAHTLMVANINWIGVKNKNKKRSAQQNEYLYNSKCKPMLVAVKDLVQHGLELMIGKNASEKCKQ